MEKRTQNDGEPAVSGKETNDSAHCAGTWLHLFKFVRGKALGFKGNTVEVNPEAVRVNKKKRVQFLLRAKFHFNLRHYHQNNTAL